MANTPERAACPAATVFHAVKCPVRTCFNMVFGTMAIEMAWATC